MSNNEEKSFFAQPRTIASGIVLLLVLAVAAYLVIVGASSDESNGSDDPTAAPTTTDTPTPTDPPSTNSGVTYESACGLKGGSLQAPKTAPTDIDWQTIDSWSYPVSSSAGPGKRSPSGPWSCFARTPTGAVVAAHVIGMRIILADDFETVVKQQTVPGIGQQELLKLGQPETQGVTDTKGFVIENYSNDDAVISYYLVQDGNSYTCSQEVQWRDGDWRLRLQADGSTSSGCIQSAPTVFVSWGA